MSTLAATNTHPAEDALWEMALIHRIQRRGLRDVARWIPTVPPEGAGRAGAIAAHLEWLLDSLHDHHTTEDDFLWPVLRERVPAEAVDDMAAQHEGIDHAAAEVRRLLPEWAADPSQDRATALRAALRHYRDLVTAHLDEEERDVVPLIARHVTAEEWAAIGEEGFRKIPASKRFTAVGQLLQVATPREAEHFTAKLPLPARVGWRLVGRRQFDRTMGTLAGRAPSGLLVSAMRPAGRASAALYRRSGGRIGGRAKGLPVMLLTVRGRRTGQEHTTAVAYFDRDGRWLVAGSGGGMSTEPQWFRNVRVATEVTVETGSSRSTASVRVLAGEERDRAWEWVVNRAPFFTGYQVKGQRLIPLAVLTPAAPRTGEQP